MAQAIGAKVEQERKDKQETKTKAEGQDGQGNPLNADGSLKVEAVSSIDEITDEDFTAPMRNVQLPELSENVAAAIGTDGKPVVIKKNILKRNTERHPDVSPSQSREILKAALYTPNLYGQNQRASHPYNWVLISVKGKDGRNKLVLLEVNHNKDFAEIVHWHFVEDRAIEKIKKQAEREGGQLLILPSVDTEEAGALSGRPSDSASESKGNIKSTEKHDDEINHYDKEFDEEVKRVVIQIIKDPRALKRSDGVTEITRERNGKGVHDKTQAAFIGDDLYLRYNIYWNGKPYIDDRNIVTSKLYRGEQCVKIEGAKNISGDAIIVALEHQGIGSISMRDAIGKLYRGNGVPMTRGASILRPMSRNEQGVKGKPRDNGDTRARIVKSSDVSGAVDVKAVAAELQSKFGVEVEVVDSLDGVQNEQARKAIATGQGIKGWYDLETGKVCIYAPNAESEQDVMATYAHEVVAHKGMRGLLGEKRYEKLCKRLGEALTPEQMELVEEYAGKDADVLGDEYIARIAEMLIDENGDIKEPTTWEKVKGAVREFFRDVFGLDLTDADIRYLLWRSGERLRRNKADVLTRAQDVVTGQELRDDAARMRQEEADYQREIREITERAKADGSYDTSNDDIRFSIRKAAPPTKTNVGYKVFYLKNGQLYPPMVANPGASSTPVGVWLDADEAPIIGQSKTGRNRVKAGGKGTQGGSGVLSYRPGWHLGVIPYAKQFNRKDASGARTLFPKDFVWAEVEYADDRDYQEEAMSYGRTKNGGFSNALAGLPRVPENGSYRYRTNPDLSTDEWVITGAMKVNRLLTPSEVDDMIRVAGREPQKRETGSITDGQIKAMNEELGLGDAELDRANSIFNEQLSAFSADTADHTIFSLGRPSPLLVAAGVEDKPLKLHGSKLLAKMKKHGFAAHELINLPKAIAGPIAVFDNLNREGNRSILTELRAAEGNFLVIIDIGKGSDIDFDVVSSIFGKSDNKVINWLNKGLATYINKGRALEYLRLSAPIAEATSTQELISAAKVIKDFQNPKYPMRGNSLPDSTRFKIGESYDVKENPVGRAEPGLNSKTVKTVAAELQDKFGVEVEVVDSLDGVKNEQARKAISAGQDIKGWYDLETGKVCIYAPNAESEQDVMATYAHEVVAHKGMRGLLGEKRYGELCERLGEALTPEQLELVEEYEGSSAGVLGDEYIARIAEMLIDEKGVIKEPTTWEKVKGAVREFFRDVLGLELTDADIRYLLWRSGERLRRNKADTMTRAQDVVTGERLQEESARMRQEEADYQREIREITERAKADGTFMKAPNGKPSNLDERQWAHVRSTRFKQWFGDWELLQLYSQALRAWGDKESKGKTIVSLSGRAKQRLTELFGHDFTQLVITDDAIRHIKKRHGNATSEQARGQVALTAEDIVTIPYIIGNFDMMELIPTHDDSLGNKAVEVRKRINGVSIVGTIARGKDKLFVVTSWKMEKSDALDVSSTPGPNVRNDSDIAKVKKEIEIIKKKAKNCSKVVDENGEPQVMYHGTRARFNIFDGEKIGSNLDFGTAGRGFYFTDSLENAENIARNARGEGAPVVMSCFLNIRKPTEASIVQLDGSRRAAERFTQRAQSKGFDGVTAESGYGISHLKWQVAFSPNQIKSATDNVGTYDTSNDDIRFAIGKKRKDDMRKGLLNKLTNASEEQVEQTITEIEKLGEQSKAGGDAKVEKAALHWVKQGTIILPEDGPKVLQAVKMATDKGIDVSKYDSRCVLSMRIPAVC